MKYRLQDLIDLEQFQSLMDRLNEIYPFPSAIIDNEGVILVATAWQDICTKFHRPNKECERECIKSDQYILEHLAEANPAVSYRCPRGLIDNAMPIIVDGQHLGSFFTGQFFFEEPDLEFFREQAGKFGFDEVAYLEAVKKVPIWSQEQLESYLAFIKEMIDVLSSVGLKNLKSIEAAEASRESQYFFKESQRVASIGSYKLDFTTETWESSEVFDEIFGINGDFERTISNWTEILHPDDRSMLPRYLREEVIGKSKPFNKEYRIVRKSDGEIRWVNGLGEIQLDREGQGVALIGTVQDITERKRAEEELRKSEARWRLSLENMIEGYAFHEGIFDKSGRMVDFRYIEFNPAAQKIVGIAREDIIGKTAMALFPNITERGLMARYAEVMATGEATYIDDFYYSGDILDKAFDISCFPIDDRHFVCVFRDITDRKRAEEALQESEKWFKALAETSPLAIYASVGKDEVGEYINSTFTKLFGYTLEEVPSVKMWWPLAYPDEDYRNQIKSKWQKQVEHAIETQTNTEPLEVVVTTKDGSKKNIAWTFIAVGDRNWTCGLDLTERKQTEDALRASEYRWKFAVEGSGDGLWDWNIPENTLFFSPRWKEMLGFTNDEIGSDLSEWSTRVHPDDLAMTTADLQAHLDGKTPLCNNEYRLRCKDGSWKWILDRGIVVSRDADGKPLRMIGTHTDVTERKRAEEALHDREQRLRSYFNSPIIGIAITSPEKGWVEANPRLCAMLGYSLEELGGGLNWADLTHPDDLAADVANFERLLTGEIDDYSIEKRFIRKNGEIIWTRLGVGAVRKLDGSLNYAVAILENITERKQAEDALRESEYRWKFAVEGSGAGLWDWNVPESTVFFSTCWKEMLGFSEDEIGNGLDEWANRVHADDLARVMADVQAHLAGTRPLYSNEHRVRCKDGSWKWVLDRGVVVSRDDAGKPLRMIGSHTDVTERKKAEEALQASEARYRSLVEGAPGIVYSFSSLRGGTYYSSRTIEIFGYSPEQLYAQPMLWRDSIHPDDLPLVEQGIRDALNGRGFCIEYRILDVQGRWRWLEDRSTECKASSNEIIIEGFVLDITERKQADEERERLMAAIEQVAETIVITDTDGTIQYANPYFEQCTGHTCKEAIGQNPRILNSGEHDDAFYKQMWDTLKRGDVWTGQIVNKKKDGTLFTEEATISPVRDATGKTVNYVAVKRDITHEIELNTQLRQAQKMEAVGQLAGGIAHDFNNLLQAILGYGYLALREVGEDGPAHAFIEEMMRAGERATTLVSQLLAFSRRQVLDMKDVNLNDSIADVLKMLRRVIGEHITLDVIGSHDLGIVRADPGQIDQILMNLCVNARDAMGKSGQITIETENVWIDDEFCGVCTWARPGRYVLLSVTETSSAEFAPGPDRAATCS